ncbi:MAG: hypothetical protein GY842_09525 [bacterium]|nr:hypothetical protein [bacterium]
MASGPLAILGESGAPFAASLAGGLWGTCLYLFCSTGPTPVVTPSGWLLVLLIVIPAIYVGLATRPARAIAFKLLTLALGWTLIEAVVGLHSPSGAGEDLLTGSAGEGPHLHWLARVLGCVCSAFLVACANASLVGIIAHASWTLPKQLLSLERLQFSRHLSPQTVVCTSLFSGRQSLPRAPPL